LVQKLIDKGHAYAADGDVYFDVESFPAYGALSGQSAEERQAGARIDVTEIKRNRRISRFGRRPSRVKTAGTARGAREGRAGTLNAAR
jgi:hypothetical protein